MDKNRKNLNEKFKDVDAFKANFNMDKKLMDEFFSYASNMDSSLVFVQADYAISEDLLKYRIKAMVAENLWGFGAFYKIFNVKNEIFMKAYESLTDGTYDKADLKTK